MYPNRNQVDPVCSCRSRHSPSLTEIGQRDEERTRKKITKKPDLIPRPKGRADDIDLVDVMGYSERKRDFAKLRVRGYMRY